MELLPLILAVWIIPIAIGWYVIYSAVLAALRRHDRERAGQ